MHLCITHALYFEIYTTLIQLMSIAGYEAYVCVCFFMYKTVCAAFIWLPWDACSCLYVCLYCAKKLFNTLNVITKNTGRTKNIFKNEQKVGISRMRKSIYLLTTTPSSHTHKFHPLPLATPASCSPHPLATPIHSTHSPQLSSIL